MALIRTITLTSTAQQIIPPDGEQHEGAFQWTLINGADAATLYDDEAKDHAGGVLPASTTLQLVGEGESLWATGTGPISVIGTAWPNS